MLGFLLALVCTLTFATESRFKEEKFAAIGDGLRVGIEVEFTNLNIERASTLVAMAVNGTLKMESYESEIFVKNPQTGKIESKVVLLTQGVITNSDVGRLIVKTEDNETDLADSSQNSKNRILELVSDPISLDQVHHIQKALNFLVGAGAQGTKEGHAVSLQVNVEVGEGVITELEVSVLVELIRIYSSPRTRKRILRLLEPADFRSPYIQEFSKGFLKKVSFPHYRPSKRELFDDLMYRQMLELMGNKSAWSLPISKVQSLVLADLNSKIKEGKDLGQAFFQVIKFSRIKLASVMIYMFPDDPLSKIIAKTGWIHPIPAVEFRERNNDFELLEGIRMSVGFMNKAIARAKKFYCSRFLVAMVIE